MKPPDKIKKGLRIHSTMHNGCVGCPYKEIGNRCSDVLFKDLRDYTRQLEAQNAELLEKNIQLGRELDNTRLSFARQSREVEEYKLNLLKQVQKTIENLPKCISVEEQPWEDNAMSYVKREVKHYNEKQLLREQIYRLEAELAHVKLERDAAVRDCARFPCYTCNERENGDFCPQCRTTGTFRTLHEWRGPCAENGGTGDA